MESFKLSIINKIKEKIMFEFEGKELEFKRVTTADALKCKNLITIIASETTSLKDRMDANEMLDKLAFKYLRVKSNSGEWLENLSYDAFDTLFEHQGVAFEVSANFQKLIASFLTALPSYQNLNTGKA